MIAIVALLLSPFIALIPARAYLLTDGTTRAVGQVTGYLTTAQGVGAVIGALLITPLAYRYGRHRMLMINLTLLPFVLALYANVTSRWAAVAALGLVGMVYIGILSGANTIVQLWAPAEFRGRILSLYLVALGSIYPIGGLIQGWVIDRIGFARTVTSAALLMLAALLVWRLRRPESLRALADPAELGVDPERLSYPQGPTEEPVIPG
jgi:MFS family permease